MKRGGKDILAIMKNPTLVKGLSMDQINEWIADTPYVQYLYLLKAMKLKSENVTDPKAYHFCATMVNDRIQMNDLLSVFDSGEEDANYEKEPKKKKKKKRKNKLRKEEVAIVKIQEEQLIDSDNQTIVSEPLGFPEIEEEEESVEDWNIFLSTSNEEYSKIVSSTKDEEVMNTEMVENPTPSGELTEFTKWLIAIDAEDVAVSQQQVDQSINLQGALVNETYAQILANQGHKAQAIQMYHQLSLTNPEKSAYFAALIEKLKKQ